MNTTPTTTNGTPTMNTTTPTTPAAPIDTLLTFDGMCADPTTTAPVRTSYSVFFYSRKTANAFRRNLVNVSRPGDVGAGSHCGDIHGVGGRPSDNGYGVGVSWVGPEDALSALARPHAWKLAVQVPHATQGTTMLTVWDAQAEQRRAEWCEDRDLLISHILAVNPNLSREKLRATADVGGMNALGRVSDAAELLRRHMPTPDVTPTGC